ncbi:MAG: serine/threonine protein kinase [Planctomycetia bacterium]|nr:serine/threonine protein kinase [Planctomycetia bacterium]
MPDLSTTAAHVPDPEPLAETVVRPASAPVPALPPDQTAETFIRPPAPQSGTVAGSSGSADFAEQTRQLLRRRLFVTHGAIGLVTGKIALLGWMGLSPLPAEAGLGVWAIGLPLLAFGQSVVGLVFLLIRPTAPLGALRLVEVTQFAMIALGGGIARFVVLTTPPARSPDPRFHDILYRHDSAITTFPLIFAVVIYGVLIPNTRRRSLLGTGLLCLVPIVATAVAAIVNPAVREEMMEILPATIIPLFMAAVIAVFSASRTIELQREAFDAKREIQELGAYTLKRKLGEGGMGEVWLAEHRLLKRPCAVKFIRAELAAESATLARFEREVRAVTKLTHFNTVRIYDYGRADDGSFYYVMEYLDGPTLDRLVRDRGPLAPGRAVYLLRQLCGALAEAHADGLIHRDLKPNNIIVATLGGQHDVSKLLDFGLVQDLGSVSSTDPRITRAGTVLGTPSYMCPEQAAGEPVADPRGDIYSLGAVAFFLLTGRPPFVATSVGKLLSAHLTQPAPFVTEVRADVPADLAAVVAKCLAKDPKERFASATELESALGACECAGDWSASVAAQWWSPDATTPDAEATNPNQTQTLIT